MIWKWNVLFVTLATYVTLVLSCSCGLLRHPQQKFCDAAFSLHIETISVKGESTDPNNPNPDPFTYKNPFELVYTVKVLENFKGGYYQIGSLVQVHTQSEGIACGMRLMKSQNERTEWLITGTLGQGKLRIDSCGLNLIWESLTNAQVTGLRGKYKHGCQCTICSETFCLKEGVDVCTYSSRNAKCYEDAFCQPNGKRGGPGCSWSTACSK